MSVEQVVSMPIVNPETGKSSRTFEYAGKVDKVEGDTVVDWKGTGDALRFIRQKKIGFQGECYALACMHAGTPIRHIDYRLIERPTIGYRLPTITWAVKRASAKKALKLCDNEAEARTLADLRGAGVTRRVKGHENRQEYEECCMDWLCDPEYPHRAVSHEYHLTDARLDTARHWLWNCCKRLLDCKNNMRWLPNEQACYTFNRECPYMPLCEAVAEGSDYAWIKEQEYEAGDPHPELNGHEGEREVVTYSSLSCLSLCEVKYFWRYVTCLRQTTDGDAEPLWVGSAMHRGMEVLGGGAYMHVALAAVDEWGKANPVLGEDAAWKQDQQVARARAMVRVAAMKWGKDAVDVSA